MNVVEAERVTKTFGAVRALRGVSLAVAAGEGWVLRGPNGSGKSTLLALLGGVLRPSTGVVRYPALGGRRERARTQMGWLGHEVQAYGDLTVDENLEFFRLLAGTPREPVRALAARLGLQEILARPVRGCSRGQRQRVALARALIAAPRLLLLDEPTTGLDAAACERLVRILREEAARGVAQVVVTHDVQFARDCGATRELWLERGVQAPQRAAASEKTQAESFS